MKPLLILFGLLLGSATLSAEPLSCGVEFFRVEGKTIRESADLVDLTPQMAQAFTVTLGQEQIFMTKVDGLKIRIVVTVMPKDDRYQIALRAEAVEATESAPQIDTTFVTNGRFVLKLAQPQLVGVATETNTQKGTRSKAWRITLTQ
ncbi:MAG: hypothetical protein KBF26_09955 [Opitutaceae bacterium]|nr:hypothetical protein [Opitutaceae bacterium]